MTRPPDRLPQSARDRELRTAITRGDASSAPGRTGFARQAPRDPAAAVRAYAPPAAGVRSFDTQNTAAGEGAMLTAEGGACTAYGFEALNVNTTGVENTGLGVWALTFATSGSHNTGVGYRSLFEVTTGGGNTAAGSRALNGVATGGSNVGVGESTGTNIVAGNYNTFLGQGTGTTGGDLSGAVAIGVDNLGGPASAAADNEFRLGTVNHVVIVEGKLVIADASHGLHQIVVSTGGVLSTVAYP